jgi:hypothetical protein
MPQHKRYGRLWIEAIADAHTELENLAVFSPFIQSLEAQIGCESRSVT